MAGVTKQSEAQMATQRLIAMDDTGPRSGYL